MSASSTTLAWKRAGVLCALLLAELLSITTWLDGAALAGRTGLVGQIGLLGAWILRFLVGFTAAFAAFAGLQGKLKMELLLSNTGPIRWPMLAAHVACAVIFGMLSAAIYGNQQLSAPDLVAVAWIAAGILAVGALGLALHSLSTWVGVFRASGTTWMFAAGVAGFGVGAVGLSQSMWQSAAKLTFFLVQILLRPVLPNLIVQPERMRLQGHTFGVIINQECSGLEGVGLMLVFSAAWLWLFRADLRFPRAYLLVPVGVVTLYLLNAVRIAALLLIGDAGAQRIAAGGFHSQAGWIAFNGVALAMTLIVPRIAWFAQRPQIRTIPEAQGENPTAAYLMPFLAILASGMLSRAASADFEWLYSLRFVAALTALWIFKRRLVSLDWRFGASGVLAGVVVFGMWLAFDRWQAIPVATMPFALEASSPTARSIWIVFRALAATTTVPIAEELAFRGFLMRRVSSADFEALPLRSSTWLGILISSIVFGMLHGDRWIAGILAGLIFALVARHTNRIGDAFVGHAFANALLSVWVLYLGQWQYW